MHTIENNKNNRQISLIKQFKREIIIDERVEYEIEKINQGWVLYKNGFLIMI